MIKCNAVLRDRQVPKPRAVARLDSRKPEPVGAEELKDAMLAGALATFA